MKTKQEIERAIHHLRESAESLRGTENQEYGANMIAAADALSWAAGLPSYFEKMVMRPCDQVDDHQNN